jgi:hypothetical protein
MITTACRCRCRSRRCRRSSTVFLPDNVVVVVVVHPNAKGQSTCACVHLDKLKAQAVMATNSHRQRNKLTTKP